MSLLTTPNHSHRRLQFRLHALLVFMLLVAIGVPQMVQAGEFRMRVAQSIEWQMSSLGQSANFRGIVVVDNQTVWSCGSNGKVVKTVDRGQTWRECSPVGFGSSEFRCIHAFNAEVACIASAGTPAVLLRTSDGGKNWAEVYRHDSPQAFFDALAFWNGQDGLAVSDPIDGRWLILRTVDGGRSWQELAGERLPLAPLGESAFAASNGSLSAVDKEKWWLATGGSTGQSTAAILRWNVVDSQWQRIFLPMPTSESSGVFALDFSRQPWGVAVGGDYKQESQIRGTAAWTEDGGVTWHAAQDPPAGYRSSVIYWKPIRGSGMYVAVGPTGSDVSLDGKRWSRASAVGFHAVRSAPDGRLWGVGADGRLGTADSVIQSGR